MDTHIKSRYADAKYGSTPAQVIIPTTTVAKTVKINATATDPVVVELVSLNGTNTGTSTELGLAATAIAANAWKTFYLTANTTLSLVAAATGAVAVRVAGKGANIELA